MQEINLKKLFKYFMKKMFLFLIIIILFIILGRIYYNNKHILKYQTTSILAIKNDAYSSNTYDKFIVDNSTLNTYSAILKSKDLLNSVIKDLNLNYNYKNLFNNISISLEQSTGLIKVRVNSTKNGNEALLINNQLILNFKNSISNYLKDGKTSILIIEDASEPIEIHNIIYKKIFVVSLFMGLICGFSLIFLMYYFKNTIDDEEYIIDDLGLNFFTKLLNKHKYNDAYMKSIKNIINYINYMNYKTILFSSVKNGEGRRHIATDIAVMFANNSLKTLIIDLNKNTNYNIYNLSLKKYNNIYKTNIKNLYLLNDNIEINKFDFDNNNYDKIIIIADALNSSNDYLNYIKSVGTSFIVTRLNYTKKNDIKLIKNNISLIKNNNFILIFNEL